MLWEKIRAYYDQLNNGYQLKQCAVKFAFTAKLSIDYLAYILLSGVILFTPFAG